MIVLVMIVLVMIVVIVVVMLMVVVVVVLRVLHGVHPHGGTVDLVEVEAVGVQQLAHGNVALRGLHDHGVLLQAADDGTQLVDLLARHLVALVEDEGGAELDLLDEQGLQVLLVHILGQQVATAVELVPHARAVHHGHDVIEVERSRAVPLGAVAEVGDGVRDGHRLADARGLDDDVVEVTRGCNLLELAREIVGKRAAEATVGHGDELAVDLREAALGDQVGVHVDLANVVHEHRRADALVVGEDVVQQRGLTRAQVARNEDSLGLLGMSGFGHGCSFSAVPNSPHHHIPKTTGRKNPGR